MNITRSDVLDWDGLQAVADSLASELDDYTTGDDGRMRFTIEPNRYLDVVEVPAEDEFKSYRNRRLHNTACLLLVKADCSELMFTKREMTAAGDYKTKTYTLNKDRLQKSDIDLFKRIKYGDESSLDALFDTQDVVRRFYKEYKDWLRRLSASIKGIDSAADREHYAQILMSRIMFLYFIQTKNFLSDERDYLTRQWREIHNKGGNFYRDFLLVLFFNILNTRKEDRQTAGFSLVPFLNGGLFKEHDIETAYDDIQIGNDIFGKILRFLDSWMWYVDETTDYEGGAQGINPEILGHIFEQTITHQHSKGAYYTPIDVTQFICDETIVPYCIRQINERFSSKYGGMLDVWKSAEHSEYFYFEILKKIKILDPSCGSGEFLLTASRILFGFYKNAWNAIKNQKSSQVELERKLMAGCPEHYFKRSIVTENLYGVDIENGALEICRLRLWLSLVSTMSRDTADPLPNIDYNIMQGNSLVGYTDIPEKQQYSIDNPYCIEDILKKIDRLKDAYNAETDPAVAAQLRKSIEQEVEPCNDLLNKTRASDIAPSVGRRLTASRMKKINPFHWRLHFHEAVATGGFDAIVGNPPYIVKTDYPTKFLETHKACDTYAYFVEISLKLLKPGGRLGYIIPVPSMSTEKKAPLQNLLLDSCSVLKISNYDDRPNRLFVNLEHCRSSIILGTKHNAKPSERTCAVFTTGYHRWESDYRHNLLKNIRYTSMNFSGLLPCTRNGIPTAISKMSTIPKIGDELEIGILAKIYQKPPLEYATCKRSGLAVYYHTAPQYWIHAMDAHKLNKNVKDSTEVKPVELKDQKSFTVTLSLLNSSLFYWFFIKMSDCRHLNKREVHGMPIDMGEFTSADVSKLARLAKTLMKNYEEYSKIKTNPDGALREEIYPKYAKRVIDKIDDILAKHYGLTHDEATYIKQFDEKFRMKGD